MVTSGVTPEMKIWPFRACTMKNVQYNPYLRPNRRNLRVVWKIGIEELDDDVRFYTGNGNMAVFACAIKNMQYNHRYFQLNRRNFRVLQEIVVEEHDGDVILYTCYGADSTLHRTYC